MALDLRFPLAADLLIPHRPPMALIDFLLESNDNYGVATVDLHEKAVPLLGNTLHPAAYVEIAAQAYAAMRGYCILQQGLPLQPGFLVGINRFVVSNQVGPDDRLRIEVETVTEIDRFYVANARLFLEEGELVASGGFRVFSPPAADVQGRGV
ncbi:hypothetical protein [Desulfovibrio inopinatus]|uniref:hypothetical protein n=1 Tax=Desulfovibrio inopinatus TaxID=102109 RepID=UPI00042144A5|nr:hypothetical protein [Desulfovibrio inopinatus]